MKPLIRTTALLLTLGSPAYGQTGAPPAAAARIEQAYLLTLCRKPTVMEIETLTMFLNHEAAEIQQEAAAAGANLSVDAARKQALIRLCRVIFNLNEFVYPD